MTITLNGQPYRTDVDNLDGLRRELAAKKVIHNPAEPDVLWIVDGFQTARDLPLAEDMDVQFIRRGQKPTPEEMERMLCARDSPGVRGKLRGARVAVAGLGGLGSNIAVMLTRCGVGHLHLIDFDTVDPTNLNRQQYLLTHLGMHKTEAMRQQLAQMNPGVRVRTDTVRVDENNCAALFRDDDIVCEAFDGAESKAMLTEQLLTAYPEKTLICGSGMAGYGPSNAIVTRKITDHFYLCGDGASGAAPGRGLMAPRAALCAAHEANLALRLILGLDAEDPA